MEIKNDDDDDDIRQKLNLSNYFCIVGFEVLKVVTEIYLLSYNSSILN
jgi:hypothetical protein